MKCEMDVRCMRDECQCAPTPLSTILPQSVGARRTQGAINSAWVLQRDESKCTKLILLCAASHPRTVKLSSRVDTSKERQYDQNDCCCLRGVCHRLGLGLRLRLGRLFLPIVLQSHDLCCRAQQVLLLLLRVAAHQPGAARHQQTGLEKRVVRLEVGAYTHGDGGSDTLSPRQRREAHER